MVRCWRRQTPSGVERVAFELNNEMRSCVALYSSQWWAIKSEKGHELQNVLSAIYQRFNSNEKASEAEHPYLHFWHILIIISFNASRRYAKDASAGNVKKLSHLSEKLVLDWLKYDVIWECLKKQLSERKMSLMEDGRKRRRSVREREKSFR